MRVDSPSKLDDEILKILKPGSSNTSRTCSDERQRDARPLRDDDAIRMPLEIGTNELLDGDGRGGEYGEDCPSLDRSKLVRDLACSHHLGSRRTKGTVEYRASCCTNCLHHYRRRCSGYC